MFLLEEHFLGNKPQKVAFTGHILSFLVGGGFKGGVGQVVAEVL